MNRKILCSLAIALAAILMLPIVSCKGARPPQKEPEPFAYPVENLAENVEAESASRVLEYDPIPIQAIISGTEFEIENIEFTHMAISSDEDYEYSVKVNVEVNNSPAGWLYADGWEDESPEKLRIDPGTISKWVPIRGDWGPLTGTNVLKLSFVYLTIKGLEAPPKYFEGKLWLKNDPEALGDDVPVDENGDEPVQVENPEG